MPDRDAISNMTREAAVEMVLRLLDANGEMQAKLLELEQQNAALQQEIPDLRSRLGGGGAAPAAVKPDWVRPNRKPRTPKKRKKRNQAHTRPKQPPTHVEVHAVDRCPDCDRKLEGGWVHRTRQIIEIPVVPVQIIDHVILARTGGVCGKRHIPTPDLSEVVVGKHRLGVRLMSFIRLAP